MSEWLLWVNALNGDDQPETLRFSTGFYVDPSEHFWQPRIVQPGLYRAGLSAGQLLSSERSGYGETQLVNNDSALDYLVDYAVDGRSAGLRLVADNGRLSDVWVGTVQRLAFESGTVSVRLRDPLESLQQNHPRGYYAGDNVLPDGLEGTSSDIKGQPKPRLYGECVNAVPAAVNTSKLIYEISDRDCSVSAVYDNGVSLTRGVDYADLADLQSSAPDAGQWRAYQGYIRLGSLPVGSVTVDASVSSSILSDVVVDLLSDVGLSLDAADYALLSSYDSIRLWLVSEVSTAALLDQLAASIGGFWRLDIAGVVHLEVLSEPVAPVLVLEDYQILDIGRTASGAGSNGLPVYRVSVEADPVETVQDSLAGSVSAARRARMSSAYRIESAELSSVKVRHPLSEELTVTSRLGGLSQAADVADRVLQLLSVRRDFVSLTARIDQASGLVVGDSVRVVTQRLGYGVGRDFLVVGHTMNAVLGELELKLWG